MVTIRLLALCLKSHISEGKQPLGSDLDDLKYGVSITDACIDWVTTETLLAELNNGLKEALPARL